MLMPSAFLFFFQAEDGIRGLYVTGVQTCALPICSCGSSSTLAASPQVAGVVVREELQDVLRRSEAAGVDELPQELGMVDDVVLPAEVGIFVLQRVEAVGTRRDDPRHPIPVEGLHVAPDHRLGQVFVAEAP